MLGKSLGIAPGTALESGIEGMRSNVSRTMTACCVWATLGLGMQAFAETLNGLRPGGLPLGYWVSAQGTTLLLAAIAAGLILGLKPGSAQPASVSGKGGSHDA